MNPSNPQFNVTSFRKCKSKHDRSVRQFDKNGNRAVQLDGTVSIGFYVSQVSLST